MGLDFTFNDTAVLFSIIGAGFGASTSTMTIENLFWSETSIFKKVLRGLLGSAFIVSIFLIWQLIPEEDHPTLYFFRNLLPHLLSAYFGYGIVPIISKYIGLVNKSHMINENALIDENYDNSKSFESSVKGTSFGDDTEEENEGN